MSAYLESALSLEEYREAKNKLVNQNQLLKEKLSAFEQKANNRSRTYGKVFERQYRIGKRPNK